MKRTEDGWDTELAPADSDRVLIGTYFVPVGERKEKEWQLQVLQLLSKEVSFIPEILDYQILSGESYQIAIANIPSIIHIEDYLRDLVKAANINDRSEIYSISQTLIHHWKAELANFNLKYNVLVEIYEFWDGTCMTNQGLKFINFDNVKIDKTPKNDKNKTRKMFHSIFNSNVNDIHKLNDMSIRFIRNLYYKEEITQIKKDFQREKTFLEERYNSIIEEKNKKLKGTINKDIVKQQLGEDLYYLHFGEENDS